MRLDALWALSYWAKPPVLDRVDNYFRQQTKGIHRLMDARDAFEPLFIALRNSENSLFTASLFKAAGRLNYKKGADIIFAALKNPSSDPYVRQEALYALLALDSKYLPVAIANSLTDPLPALRRIALANLGKAGLKPEKQVRILEKLVDADIEIPEKQNALAALGNIQHADGATVLSKFLHQAFSQTIDPALYLDIFLAVENSSFIKLKSELKDRQKKWKGNDLEEYQATLYGGNAERGKEIFIRNEAAQCLRCHALYGRGGVVGPPLEYVADNLSREELLIALINPNARIAMGYGVVLLTLKDGEELSGILVSESKSALTVKIGSKAPRVIPVSAIKEREMLPSAMMNAKEVLDKAQIRDLLAFLVHLKKENEGKLLR
jgi:putative heme-binding domain-containing protein